MTTNIDDREIAKFAQLASRWWDPEGEFKPLHDLNPLRRDYIIQRAGALQNRQVLDVGCGGGLLAESMAQLGADVLGIDAGADVLAVAQLHQLETGVVLTYRQSTVEALAREQSACYDVITCMEMLEHVPDPASIVRACAHLLKPGGHVFFSTLNRTPSAYLLAIIGAEYVLRLLPKGTHHYRKFIRPSELDTWMMVAGLHLSHLTGIQYNPILRQCGLRADLSVNYIAHAYKVP